MGSQNAKRLHKAAEHLRAALAQYDAAKTALNFLTVTKAFEVLLEYHWRDLKTQVEAQGLEAPSPKLAITQGAKLALITDPETWLDCLEARNNSVHDYFGISEAEFIALARQFLVLATGRASMSPA